jgi:nucleoside-triphosphatase
VADPREKEPRNFKNLLVTGKPGVGKTTLIERVVNVLDGRVGGFYTHEIREKGGRVGFRLMTWEGDIGILAHVNLRCPFRVGKYGVDIATMNEIGVPSILKALEEADLIAIDEVGRMELFSDAFKDAVMSALESEKPLLAVIQERPDPFLDGIRHRTDVRLIPVTFQNRDSLVQELKDRLKPFI